MDLGKLQVGYENLADLAEALSLFLLTMHENLFSWISNCQCLYALRISDIGNFHKNIIVLENYTAESIGAELVVENLNKQINAQVKQLCIDWTLCIDEEIIRYKLCIIYENSVQIKSLCLVWKVLGKGSLVKTFSAKFWNEVLEFKSDMKKHLFLGWNSLV